MRWKSNSLLTCIASAAVAAGMGWYGIPSGRSDVPGAAGSDPSVTIFGQVMKQGKYAWHDGMTVRELLRESGGFSRFASLKVTVVGKNSKPSGFALLWHHARLWTHNSSAAMSLQLGSTWKSCGLPGEPPDLSISKPPSPTGERVDLRKPRTDRRLFPGNMVIVHEKLISF